MEVDKDLRSSSWVRKILEKFASELTATGKIIHHGLFNAFEDYSLRIYNKNSVFRSIVFKNEQKRLADYYLPLTLLDSSNTARLIDRYPGDLFYKRKKAIIIDTAGMGKSTLMRFMYLDALDQKVGIPIFFELRRLVDLDREGFLDVLLRDFSGLGEKADKDLMITLLREGEFIFLLDGFDEIPDSQKSKAIETLNEFIERAPRNLFVISSRDEPSLVSFADFKRFNIRPLERNESDELIRKYAEDQDKANNLIEVLQKPEYRSAIEFLSNPLLVSLLYRSYEYKNKVPLRKHLFYEQVFNSLFEEHDLSKDGKPLDREKRSKLSLDRFHKVMRALGFLTYFRDNKLQYTVPELKKIIGDSAALSGEKSLEASAFFVDLEQKVPLLTRDGVDVRWTHKSIQEYFAADFIFKDHPNKEDFWQTALMRDSKHNNVNFVSLYKGIDEKGYRQIVVKSVIELILNEYSDWQGKMADICTTEEHLRQCFEISYPSRVLIYSDKLPVLAADSDPNVHRLISDEIRRLRPVIVDPRRLQPSSYYLANPTISLIDDAYASVIEFVLDSTKTLLRVERSMREAEFEKLLEGSGEIVLDYVTRIHRCEVRLQDINLFKNTLGRLGLKSLSIDALKKELTEINAEITAQASLLRF